MKNSNRMTRINDEIKRETSNMIQYEMRDPRLTALVSVVRAETTADLKYCKLYISVLGDDKQQKEVMEGLKNASGFIRKGLAEKINLRNTPELIFKLDDSVAYGVRMTKLIDEVNKPNG